MRVILELRTGPHAGRKSWLQSGQTLQVGRTDDSDFVVADDAEMSDVHFAVQVDRAGCRVTDLNSARGTFVNGAQIQTEALADGDEIAAGRTVIQVRIDSVRLSEEVPSGAPTLRRSGTRSGVLPEPTRRPQSLPPATVPRSAPRVAGEQQPIQYVQQKCGSGLLCLSGRDDKDDPALVLRRLTKLAPCYLVVDLAKLDARLPAGRPAPTYLLNWLPEAAQPTISPVVMSVSENPTWPALLAEAWGRDGLIGFFSTLDPQAVLEQLRRAARYNPTTGIELEDETALSYWWPDVMRLVLMHSPAGNVQYLLDGLQAVLLEAPGGKGWHVFAFEDIIGSIEACGFELATADPQG